MTGMMSQSRSADAEPEQLRRSHRLPLAMALTVVLVVVLGWVVAFSSLLGVRNVTVLGAHTLSVQQVRAAAAVRHGTPLLRLDTAAVRRRVATLPGVADVRVHVSYPSTVVIEIAERAPVGYEQSGAQFNLIDKSGAAFESVSVAPASLPRFALPTGVTARATGEAVATVAGALAPSVLSQLAEISADDPASISLILRDGRTVTWGSSAQSGDKARLLPALLARPGRTFDVSDPSLIVVR